MPLTVPVEAALTSDLRGEPYNFSLWDIHTGTQLVVFKGNKGNPIAKGVQLIDNNYFITCTDNLLNVWSIYNRKCQDQKLFLPGRPSCICITQCGQYLIAGISEVLYIWQLHSGNLLAQAQRHYQTISVLKLSLDGAFVFSGGEDGLVMVWPFADLVSGSHNLGAMRAKSVESTQNSSGSNEPRFTWQHHSDQVTDVQITAGGRCITVSADMSANIYDYTTGKRLHSITFPSPIYSVVIDKNETRAYFGAQDGNIYELVISSICKSDAQESERPMLIGHSAKVVSMAISIDGTRLISASADASCKIWDIDKRKLIQDIKHQAPLANLLTLLVPDSFALTNLTQSKTMPTLKLKPLKRILHKPSRDATIAAEELFEESNTIVYVGGGSTPKACEDLDAKLRITMPQPTKSKKAKVDHQSGDASDEEVARLRKNLSDVYRLCVNKIFKDATVDLVGLQNGNGFSNKTNR